MFIPFPGTFISKPCGRKTWHLWSEEGEGEKTRGFVDAGKVERGKGIPAATTTNRFLPLPPLLLLLLLLRIVRLGPLFAPCWKRFGKKKWEGGEVKMVPENEAEMDRFSPPLLASWLRWLCSSRRGHKSTSHSCWTTTFFFVCTCYSGTSNM